MTLAAPNSRVLTLVFTDLAGSTALKSQRGDVAGGDLIARHREHVLRLAAQGGGTIIDWAGDGCFLTFDTASAAVVFALRLQQVHKYETDLPGVRVEALLESRLLAAAAADDGERPGQRVEQRPFVSSSPVDREERPGRAAARPGSNRIWEHPLPWRHLLLAAPVGTQTIRFI